MKIDILVVCHTILVASIAFLLIKNYKYTFYRNYSCSWIALFSVLNLIATILYNYSLVVGQTTTNLNFLLVFANYQSLVYLNMYIIKYFDSNNFLKVRKVITLFSQSIIYTVPILFLTFVPEFFNNAVILVADHADLFSIFQTDILRIMFIILYSCLFIFSLLVCVMCWKQRDSNYVSGLGLLFYSLCFILSLFFIQYAPLFIFIKTVVKLLIFAFILITIHKTIKQRKTV